MKAHRWYSAFRNVGIWAICVVVAWVAIPGLIDTVVAFGTLILRDHYMSCPYVPDEQLFGFAQESVDRVSDQTALDAEIGPLFIVGYGNHSNEVGIWFHQRWDKPMNIGSGAREVSPNIVFSSSIYPGCSGKGAPARSKR